MTMLGKSGIPRRRLIRNEDGNALIFVAAAIFPMIAMIGGGFDIARAYLAKSRLSQACDSAALAGRRAMTNEDVTTATPEAIKFFNHNFPQSFMGTAAFAPVVTKPDVGTVQVSAATSIPTTLMKIFGFGSIPLSVTCNATQNYDNIDIVLVLDNTGSMSQNVAGTSDVGDNSTDSKMYALRQAIMSLYDQLKPAQDELARQGLRLRYGIVPYSNAVNVGKLIYSQNSNYMSTGSENYWSRVPVRAGNGSFTGWNYRQVSYNVANYVAGGVLTAPVGSSGSNVDFTWNGCIEERRTDSSIDGSSSLTSIPSNADDLNIDEIPSDSNTRWRPYLAGTRLGDDNYPSPVFDNTQYTSSGNGSHQYRPQMACPQQARRLATMTRDEMQTYVNSLYSDGGTYHDLGMIWGAHLISPNGIFGGDNPEEYNDRPVHRYVIFMTDGILDTGLLYTSYGLEGRDGRVTGGFSSKPDQLARHRQRFLIACNAAKQMDVSIWSIVFSPTTEASLQSCASSDDQYAQSTSSAALIAKFTEIGKNIGALRLSQ